jgi:membrane protein implicated in regulation of membrane protease activity
VLHYSTVRHSLRIPVHCIAGGGFVLCMMQRAVWAGVLLHLSTVLESFWQPVLMRAVLVLARRPLNGRGSEEVIQRWNREATAGHNVGHIWISGRDMS